MSRPDPRSSTPDPGRCSEPELTEAVLECAPDGRLNRAAIGWSRHPLHRCNLSGHWPRKKRWDFWCVTTDTHLLQLAFANVDYLGVLNVALLDYPTRAVTEKSVVLPLGGGLVLPETVGGGDMHFAGMGLDIAIREEGGGTRLLGSFKRHDVSFAADVLVTLPPDHETLNVVIPWSDDCFQFTSKHNTRPAHGQVVINGRTYPFGPENHAYGCLDYGRGIWPHRTTWNWASASGLQDGHTVGLNLGGQWTAGTGMTENGLCIDGRLYKLSEELIFTYDRSDFRAPWRLRTPVSDRVDLTFTPFHLKEGALNLGLLATEIHVGFGYFSGHVITDKGERLAIRDLMG